MKRIVYSFNVKMLLFGALTLLGTAVLGQTNTATPGTSATEEVDEFAKKKVETKLSEVIPTDSVAVSELIKRAMAWTKLEAPTYKKSNAASSDSKVELVASFPVKPKELNPQVDYTGKVTMKVLIECKSSKYRYTISEIKHISKNGRCSAGAVDNVVPECGSKGMTDVVWKKLRGEMLAGAAKVAADLKTGMSTIVSETPQDEW